MVNIEKTTEDLWGRFDFDTKVSKVYKDHKGRMHLLAVASDTQMDLQDDRMSLKALRKMAAQLKKEDLPLLESHSSTFGFGTSHDASIDKVDKNVWEMTVDFTLKSNFPQSIELFESVSNGRGAFQLSIGGMINRGNPDAVTFETDKDTGMMVRVINDVVLDHIASTRPNGAANPRTRFLAAIVKSLNGVEEDEKFLNWHKKPSAEKGVDKGVIPYRYYPLADENMPWSFSKKDKDALIEEGGFSLYKSVHAQVDDNESSVPEKRSAYKFAHHKFVDDVLVTVANGVVASMNAVRNDKTISQEDRAGVIAHLSSHFVDFGLTPPTEKELDDMAFKDYVNFIKKQGFDANFLEDLMQKNLDGTIVEPEETKVAKENVKPSVLESFDELIATIKKGFTADQLSGDLAQRMRSMQEVLLELLGEEKTNKTEKANQEEVPSAGISESDFEKLVTKMAEVNATAIAEIVEAFSNTEALEGVSKSVGTLKETVANNNEFIKSEIDIVKGRLDIVEQVGGQSQAAPIFVAPKPEKTEKQRHEELFSGIWSDATKKALSRIN